MSADLAQLVEQRFCKPPVVGSTPIVSSIMAWFPSGQRDQTVNLTVYAFGSSNLPHATIFFAAIIMMAGVAQLVEHQPSKLGVVSSRLIARSIIMNPCIAHVAQW